MQCLCRIIRQLRLESAKSQPAGIQRFLILSLIQRDHIINQPVNAKAAALCILKIILSVHSRQRPHRSPLGIAALLRDLSAQIIRHVNDVLHQSFHVLEDLGIDLLQNIFLRPSGLHGKSAIDVPAAVRLHRHDLLPRKELLQNLSGPCIHETVTSLNLFYFLCFVSAFCFFKQHSVLPFPVSYVCSSHTVLFCPSVSGDSRFLLP